MFFELLIQRYKHLFISTEQRQKNITASSASVAAVCLVWNHFEEGALCCVSVLVVCVPAYAERPSLVRHRSAPLIRRSQARERAL
jgi:hypothetical protein